jgi:hypothetical protein
MPITLRGIESGPTATRKALEDIDDDTKQAVEDAYLYCLEFPAQRVEAEFENEEAAEAFLKDARAYAYQREGRLVVEGNATRTRNITEGTGKNKTTRTVSFARFRVKEYVAPVASANGDSETPPEAGE